MFRPKSSVFERWYRGTALDDLLGVAVTKVHTDRLYHGLDQLLPCKEAIERHLKERLGELFDLEYGRARRIWVLDRGMVSEANLRFLRAHEGRYIVGTPRAMLRQFEQHLVEQG